MLLIHKILFKTRTRRLLSQLKIHTSNYSIDGNFILKREGALQSQARAEIELRGNCSVRSLGDSKLEMGHQKQEMGH